MTEEMNSMKMDRLNELVQKGKGRPSVIFSSLTEEEEQEKLQLYRELFPADPERVRHLRKIAENVQRPDHWDDDAVRQSPITNAQLNTLDIIERYAKVGYRLAFVAPEVEEVIKEKRNLFFRSYIQRKRYIEQQISPTDESQTYKLDITAVSHRGKLPESGPGLMYVIDLPEDELHDPNSLDRDLRMSEMLSECKTSHTGS